MLRISPKDYVERLEMGLWWPYNNLLNGIQFEPIWFKMKIKMWEEQK